MLIVSLFATDSSGSRRSDGLVICRLSSVRLTMLIIDLPKRFSTVRVDADADGPRCAGVLGARFAPMLIFSFVLPFSGRCYRMVIVCSLFCPTVSGTCHVHGKSWSMVFGHWLRPGRSRRSFKPRCLSAAG